MATLSFDRVNRCIIVDPPDLEVTVQEIYNAAREFEAEIGNMDVTDDDTASQQGGVVQAAGKEDLGGGFQVGITLELINDWRLIFSDPGPTDGLQGAIVRGGNLVATNAFNNNPIKPQNNVQVTIAQATSAVIVGFEAALGGLEGDIAAVDAKVTASGVETTLIKKILVNRLELAEGSTGNWLLYDDDDSTVLLTWDVTDKDGAGITLDTGVPARRTRGT